MFRHEVAPLTVGAFDLGGVLYHAKYLELLEMARAKLLIERGYPYGRLMQEGYHIVITETAQRFLAPIRYEQTILVDLWVTELKKSSFAMDYHVWTLPPEVPPETTSENDSRPTMSTPIPGATLTHTATTKLACVKLRDPASLTYGPARIPGLLESILKDLLN